MLVKVGDALLMAAGMFWQTGWSLVLGFCISSLLQAVVPAGQMQRALGRGGLRQIALATMAGAPFAVEANAEVEAEHPAGD